VKVIEIGKVVGLQVQTASLKRGERPRRVYDPAPLARVDRLRLSPRGAVGERGGEVLFDVHHADHPKSKAEPGREVTFGFTSHYGRMRERFGPHLEPGCAGENILLETDRVWALGDFSPALVLRSRRDGRTLRLREVTVAAPCVEFSRFSLDDPAAGPQELKPVLQFLDAGVRGYCFTPAGEGVVEIGDTLELAESP
jgi:hypothetical protein